MNDEEKWLCIIMGLVVMGMILFFMRTKETFYKLEDDAYSTDNSFFSKNIQTEKCFDLYNISNIHDLGFDPMQCNSTSPQEFSRRIFSAERCKRGCGDDNCRGACYAREFVRNPMLDQTALPLIMS